MLKGHRVWEDEKVILCLSLSRRSLEVQLVSGEVLTQDFNCGAKQAKNSQNGNQNDKDDGR